MADALFDTITAHCFFGWCKHTATGLDGNQVHAAMEKHYATAHRADLDAMLRPTVIRSGLIA